MKKRRKIEEDLKKINERLANAEDYVTRDENIEGSSWLHSDDWDGKSGHPLWMKNHMIPTTKKIRARMERALENINKRSKGKQLKQRKKLLKPTSI
jgi:hypothetical protein